MKTMQKTLLASAMTAAILGLSACGGGDTTAGLDGAPQSQAQAASVSFSANLPQSQTASAAVIDDNASELVVRMYHLDTLVSVMEAYMENNQSQPDAVAVASADYGYDYYDPEMALEMLKDYQSKDTVTAAEAIEMAKVGSGLINALRSELAYGTDMDTLMGDKLIEASLTQDNPTTTIEEISTGTYFMALVQKDADGELLSSQKMFANLGEGDNPVVANMMTGTWTFVSDQGTPTPYQFGLLASTDDSVAKDWNPMVEGTQGLLETISYNEATQSSDVTTTGAKLNKIHHLSSNANPVPTDDNGNILFEPTEYLYDISDDSTGFQENVMAYSDSDYMDDENGHTYIYSEMNGRFAQAYDHRLAGDKNVTSPMLFDMSHELDQYDSASGTWNDIGAGAFIVTHDFMNDDEDYYDDYHDSVYPYENTYTDADGNQQTLTLVNAYNWDETYDIAADQADPLTTTGAAISRNVITGSMIEYIDHDYNYEYDQTALTDDSALRNKLPSSDEIGMAMAMAALNPTASAAAEHPLGANCSDITFNEIDQNAEYALIDGEWVAGTVNNSYSYSYTGYDEVTQTEIYEVTGDDLNGDGTVDYFETGVVYNNSYSKEYNEATQEYDIISGTDLDGDGTVEQYEAVIGYQYENTSKTTVCTYPVRLVGSSLELPRTDFYDDGTDEVDTDTDANTGIVVD